MARRPQQIGQNTAVDRRLLADRPLREVVHAFEAGGVVPGSGSANALIATLAAAQVASIAEKTAAAGDAYRQVHQTAVDTAKRARKISAEVLPLVDEDAQAFAPVVRFRRERRGISDEYLEEKSLRAEIDALKPATTIPLRVAEAATEIADLAREMLNHGFRPARGESYTALVAALTAADGSLFVVRINVATLTKRFEEIGAPRDQRDWLRAIQLRTDELSDSHRRLFRSVLRQRRESRKAVVKRKRRARES